MTIETNRLKLVLLNPRQLRLWAEDISALEKELNCTYEAEPMDDFFLEIIKTQVELTENDPKNYMWHSFYFLMCKSDNVVIGSVDFKGIPNKKGEVEIGYGLGKNFEHNGYMTEAIKGLCDWALGQDFISHIIAETDLDGLASQRVLKRCGFQKYKQEETLWWRL